MSIEQLIERTHCLLDHAIATTIIMVLVFVCFIR